MFFCAMPTAAGNQGTLFDKAEGELYTAYTVPVYDLLCWIHVIKERFMQPIMFAGAAVVKYNTCGPCAPDETIDGGET